MTIPFLAAPALVLALTAPPIAADAPGDEVVVTGFSKPYKLTAKQLATAQRVFRKHRLRYAPQGRLYFQVKRRSGGRDLSGLRLSLRSGVRTLPLTLDAHSRFVLPDLKGDEWTLVANRGSGAIGIMPVVMSPGTTEDDVRLGDMRLSCEVTWAAIVRPSVSIVLRGLAAAVPPCRTSRVAMFVVGDRPLRDASVEAGRRLATLELSPDRKEWRYPGYDKRLPNHARVRFRYG